MAHSLIRVRKAEDGDRPRILEISSQIWDGDDYVPELLDRWFTDEKGELVVAEIDGNVIAFAHRTWTLPGIAWLEGIRTDPAHQGRGAGRAITEYLIQSSREAGATRIHLSTYIDNESSIHIIESHGFQLIGTFSYVERPADLPLQEAATKIREACPLSVPETLAFIETSEYLSLAQRQIAQGWKFFSFDSKPTGSIASLEYRIGYGRSDAPEAVLCIRHRPTPAWGGPFSIGFLDGEPDAMRRLLNHAMHDYEGKSLEAMVPIHQGRHATALSVLQQAGFKSWSGFKADVFVYEMVL